VHAVTEFQTTPPTADAAAAAPGGGQVRNKAVVRRFVEEYQAEGDLVVTRKSLLGTHTGAFMGIPPTGRDVRIDVIDIVRVRDGMVTEHGNVVDQLGLLQQLGAIPAG